ncbi:MAG: hypothetical protein J1F16_02970 [Muribaculaceae bacterium]|nr:hypothetical protein [Muribaculaceae bacterium]
MKRLKIILIIISIISIPVIVPAVTIPVQAQYNSVNTWEYIGDVIATDLSGVFTRSGQLYVKVIGGRFIYKFIYNDEEFSVTKCTEYKGYNAKITRGKSFWLLNVPEW